MRKSIVLARLVPLFSSTAQALDFGVGAKAGIKGVGLFFSVVSIDTEAEDALFVECRR